MLKKRLHDLGLLVSVVILIFTIISIVHTEIQTNKKINFFISFMILLKIAPVIYTLFSYLYNNSKRIFLFLRKICAHAKNDTVIFKDEYKAYYATDFNLQNISDRLIKELEKNKKFYLEHIEQIAETIEIKINIEHIPIFISLSKYLDDSSPQLFLSFDTSVSYNDSNTVTDIFIRVVEIISNLTPELYDFKKNENIDFKGTALSSRIEMKNYCPLYRYIVKDMSLNKNDIVFDRKLDIKTLIMENDKSDTKLDIDFETNSLTVTTVDDKKALKKIINNFIYITIT